jgi:hypothetical protein
MMKSFCQRDPLWRDLLIKGTNLPLGRWGCTLTCIADLSTYFGDNLTPAQINESLKFTSGGLVVWASANFGHFVFCGRKYGRDDAEISKAIADPLSAVLLQVAGGSHWVVAVEKYPISGLYKIADPWLGDWASMSRYWNDITGAAYFKRV